MKLLEELVCIGLVASAMSFADNEEMQDKRDGKIYHKVNLGCNVWLAENLNFESGESYCYNGAASCNQDGRLYTWEIAMVACPENWRLPTDKEWKAVLTAQGGWEGLKKWGVQIPMAGDRRADGVYHYQGESAFFWSATPVGKKFLRYKFNAGQSKYDRSPMVDGPAYSVKCVAGEKPCTSPLMKAVRAGDIQKVKKLLGAGASVNEVCFTENQKEMTSVGMDYESYSYLGMAIDKGNENMVRFLLDQGANPDAIDMSGPSDEALSMLTRATLKGNRKILEILLEKGAKVGFCDVALSIPGSSNLLKMLAERIDVDEMNNCWFGQSLVDLFSEKPEVQELLVKRGGKPGRQVCPVAPGEEADFVANNRMCGD